MSQNGTMDSLNQGFDTNEDFIPKSKRLKLDISPVYPSDKRNIYLDQSVDRVSILRWSLTSYDVYVPDYPSVNDVICSSPDAFIVEDDVGDSTNKTYRRDRKRYRSM